MQRLVLLILFLSSSLSALEWDVRGQASLWNNSNVEKLEETQIGLRYIPELSFTHSMGGEFFIDADISYDAFAGHDFGANDSRTSLSPYRFWLRCSASQFEARLGLQQIKFGQAMILRPLMWFDEIDIRDPQQFTPGVPAVLLRYYFLNNANVWLWGVLGEGKTRGMEFIASEKNSLEYGGRIQYPTPAGEAALSWHHRRADLSPLLPEPLASAVEPVPEDRFAFDGKWDVGVGLWVESALIHKTIGGIAGVYSALSPPDESHFYQKYLTIGADYTFGFGNGLHVLGEHLVFDVSTELTGRDKRSEFSALMTDYNFSLWDMAMGILYYSWETHEWYKFLTWRRTYDNFSFNISLYWNPDMPLMAASDESSAFGAGRGFQIMVIFNH